VLVLDTNVYIHAASGSLPEHVAVLLDRSLHFHCSVCLAELAVGVAAYHPRASGWAKVRDHYAALFDVIPDSRVLTPDADVWAAAGLVAGTLARSQGLDRTARKESLNDALILLTAAKAGLPVLTANCSEFDLLQQVAGSGTVLHY
jgi:predicted nucleic acid-binding protein